jgi:hypothetical protein
VKAGGDISKKMGVITAKAPQKEPILQMMETRTMLQPLLACLFCNNTAFPIQDTN